MTSDSWSPKLRYAARNIIRSAIASRLEPFGSGTHARVVGQSCVNPAAAGDAKRVKVEFAGVPKSTWKW